ncbi:3'-N-debenzoyl-2'-deoxytaxol N-benzoyltransferase [Hordeum vulgare]|nr:3'-N-debenzoyl-2'-deoxytaxol N-benzoyltransferase [Hordeum vulgare]
MEVMEAKERLPKETKGKAEEKNQAWDEVQSVLNKEEVEEVDFLQPYLHLLSPSLIELLRFCETTRARNTCLTREVVLLEKHIGDLQDLSPSPSLVLLAHDAVVHLTSSFDMSAVPFGVTLLLLFARPIPEPAETIRAALLDALAHYHPVAGRLAAEGDGELLRIEGAAGVLFVAASAGYALADVAAPLLGGLVVRYPGGICRHADPLLLV